MFVITPVVLLVLALAGGGAAALAEKAEKQDGSADSTELVAEAPDNSAEAFEPEVDSGEPDQHTRP